MATHPDDAYRGLCLLLRRRWGCDVTVVVATRGEGGQNAVGPEQGAELAAIRTRETIAAARLLDVRVRFLDLPDFGYTRTAAEAFARWQGLRPLERLRGVIDELDPDLIVTPHKPGEPHGQKRAVFHMLRTIAAEQRSTRRRFYRGVADREVPSVVLELDRLDPDLGMTYQEAAYAAQAMHRTQRPQLPLEQAIPSPLGLKYFGKDLGGGLFARVRSLWKHTVQMRAAVRRAGLPPVDFASLRLRLERLPQLSRGGSSYAQVGPLAQASGILRVLQGLSRVLARTGDARRRLDRRQRALERAVFLGARLRVRWDVPDEIGSAAIDVPLRVWNEGPYVASVRVRGLVGAASVGVRLATSRQSSRRFDVLPRGSSRLELRLVSEDDVATTRETRATLGIEITLRGCATLSATVSHRLRRIARLRIFALPESRVLVPARGGELRLSLAFEKPRETAIVGDLAMAAPLGVTLRPEAPLGKLPIAVDLPVGTRARRIALRVQVPAWPESGSDARPQPRLLRFYLKGRPGAPLVPRAECHLSLKPVRVRVPDGVRIGIVRGPDNTIEETLRAFGMRVDVLEERSLESANLYAFDTVLVDSRALARRSKDLIAQIPRFVSYARHGGHLVVLYHKAAEFNREHTGDLLAPFPLELGSERVTREDSLVKFLLPKHRLLTTPNALTVRDFDGWVQERGLYFPRAGHYDTRYDELLGIQEPAAKETDGILAPGIATRFEMQRGGLLSASLGRGSYVYCALVLHRQLRAFHAGTARLLVNLVTPLGWTRFR